MAYVIGVDVGGTFTDAVLDDDAGTHRRGEGAVDSAGLLARRDRRARGPRRAARARPLEEHARARPTTSPTARRRRSTRWSRATCPPVGFLTTRGHRGLDLHHERRGPLPRPLAARAADTSWARASPHGLLPKKHALEVTERIDRDGNVIVPLDEDQARRAIRTLLDDGVARDRGLACCGRSEPGARAAHPRARPRDRPGRVRRAVAARSARASASSPATRRRS